MKGEQPPITISKNNVCCTLAAATVKSPRLFKFLDPTCKPIASKSRQFNQEDQIFIRNETKRIQKEEIIKPSISPWRTQVLVTKNERQKKRMVIDYSQTINWQTFLDAYLFQRIEELANQHAQCRIFSTLDL